MKRNTLLGMVFSLILFSQCASEPAKEKEPSLQEVLPGNWELISATRNNKPTFTLEGVFLKFDTLCMVTTNLTGKDLHTNCKIDETGFSYKEGSGEKIFQTEIIHHDTINISTKIRTYAFTMLFSRGE